MFGEEELSEELTAFEAALASLRPRADRLDPRWRFLLAQAATLNQKMADADAEAAGQLLCSRCGGPLSDRKARHRWAWPAAFSAMTTVAAALLAALVVGVEPPTVAPSGPRSSSTARPIAQPQVEPPSSVAWTNRPWRAAIGQSNEADYLSLRDQVLRFGVDSWRIPAPAVVATTSRAEPILSNREGLDRLLRQEAL
jgi:hypothetical protein